MARQHTFPAVSFDEKSFRKQKRELGLCGGVLPTGSKEEEEERGCLEEARGFASPAYRDFQKNEDNNEDMRLSNTSTLLFLQQRSIKQLDSRELRVLFYEAKQLKIQERYMPEPNSFSVLDASREIAFTGGKSKKTLAAAMSISDDKMESLLSNCGERIKLVEIETGTHIQIISLFHHPCNPRLLGPILSRLGLPENTPRKAYIHGSQSSSEYATSLLKNYGKTMAVALLLQLLTEPAILVF